MNNNLGSATLQMNQDIAKQHVKPKEPYVKYSKEFKLEIKLGI